MEFEELNKKYKSLRIMFVITWLVLLMSAGMLLGLARGHDVLVEKYNACVGEDDFPSFIYEDKQTMPANSTAEELTEAAHQLNFLISEKIW